MPRKSQIRIAAEAAIAQTTFEHRGRVWIDRSNSGIRIKFFSERPSPEDISIMREAFAGHTLLDTRVSYVKPTHNWGYGGITFKVFYPGNL